MKVSKVLVAPYTRIVNRYLKPGDPLFMRPFPRPLVPYNARLNTVEESIHLSLAYLGACNPPFPGGSLMTYDDTNKQTVMWPIATIMLHPVQEPIRSKYLEYDVVSYLFDAQGTLVRRSGTKRGTGQPQLGRPVRMHSSELRFDLKKRLLLRLELSRKKLVEAALQPAS